MLDCWVQVGLFVVEIWDLCVGEGSIQIIGEENEGNVTDSNPGNRGSGGFLIKPISNGSVQMIGETESPVEKRRSNLAQSTGGFTLSMNNINKSNFIDNATIQRKGSSPSFFHVPEEELEINDIEGVRKDRVEDGLVFFSKNFQILLKGGTIEKIIERIIVEKSQDLYQDLIGVFLLTYRSFLTSSELLDLLMQKFNFLYSTIESDGVELRLLLVRMTTILNTWVTDYFHDFADDEEISRQFYEQVSMVILPLDELFGKKTIQAFESAKENFFNSQRKEIQFNEPPPLPIVPKNNTFKDFDPEELARQMCLFEQEIFREIKPVELMDQNWNKNKEAAPHLTMMIAFFNNLSRAVASLICSYPTPKERGKIILKVLKTIGFLAQFNNYNSAQALCSALNSAGVYRMGISWYHAKKNKRAYDDYVEVQETLSPDGSYKGIRNAIRNASPPCIPFLGVYLTDLTFIEDGNSKTLIVEYKRDDIINFEKMRKVSLIIQNIMLLQQKPYNFEPVPVIQDFLEGISNGVGCDQTEEEDYEISRELEPKDKIVAFLEKKKKREGRVGSVSWGSLKLKKKM
eukprot:TRINITY_DN1253_c0_g1_i1.p1 TRINITY_DN1253_c0_g1~~TRINITY_DN1253_c0_g1_i1.p1  ORF type:complete len:573 (-),score=132.49 TRINITY_DN1253_c0_g1_i1:20-1738(-)